MDTHNHTREKQNKKGRMDVATVRRIGVCEINSGRVLVTFLPLILYWKRVSLSRYNKYLEMLVVRLQEFAVSICFRYLEEVH